jgi:hypothetical protein
MAKWKNNLDAAPVPKADWLTAPKKGAPKLNKMPKAVKPKAPRASGSGSSGTASGSAKAAPWYSQNSTGARDAALAAALGDPLAPTTGDQAVAFARSLVQSQSAPVMQEYDRQQGLAESKYKNQAARQTAGTDQLRAAIAAQLAGQQQSQAKAREQIAGAGQQLQQTVNTGEQQATQAATADAAVRGGGLDGGSAAQLAQEAANARARGQAGSQIALDTQAQQGAQGDALLNQIMAVTAQQGGERQGALTAGLNSQVRDLNQGRAKDLSAAQSDFVKTLMDIQGQNTQTKLATETLGLNTAKAQSDAQAAQDQLKQQADIASLNAKIKVTEGAEQRKLRAQLAKLQSNTTVAEGAANRSSREGIASANRTSAEKRAEVAAAAKAAKDAAKPKTLTPQDKSRRQFIRAAEEFYDGGTLKALKSKVDKQGGGPSQFRQALANRDIKDTLARQLLTDVAYGGLRPNTIAAYRARYGRNPPSTWKRYKGAAAPAARSDNPVAGGVDTVVDALNSIGG